MEWVDRGECRERDAGRGFQRGAGDMGRGGRLDEER